MYQTLLALQQGLILPPEFVCLFHCFAGFYPNFVRSTSCFVCLPNIPQSSHLVPLFCFVVFFIYCLLFISLSFCYCLMRVSSKFYVLWSSSYIVCQVVCLSIIFLCLMRVSSVFIFSVGIFVIFVHFNKVGFSIKYRTKICDFTVTIIIINESAQYEY